MSVPLDPTTAKNLTVTASDGTNNTNATQSLTWQTTDLNGKHSSTDSVKIRKNDSLLLTASGAGSVLTIDANGDGTVDFTGAPGQTFAFQYSTPGTYTATASIDGTPVGTLLVIVIGVDLTQPIACEVTYQRSKTIAIAPAAQAASVSFTSSDAGVLNVSAAGATANGEIVLLQPLSRGNLVMIARLGNNTGPIIGAERINEFTLDLPAMKNAIINSDTNIGSTPVIMRPYVANVIFNFNMFAHTATFAGGATTWTVNTSDTDGSGQPLFQQSADASTSDTIGSYSLELDVPANETM